MAITGDGVLKNDTFFISSVVSTDIISSAGKACVDNHSLVAIRVLHSKVLKSSVTHFSPSAQNNCCLSLFFFKKSAFINLILFFDNIILFKIMSNLRRFFVLTKSVF